MQKNTLSYCGELVRRYDADRFLISMYAPANVREDLWALFAFNHEIAKTREVVSDSTLGLIRLQWWRDAIKGVYDGAHVPEHEVLKPLASAIVAHKLPREHFDQLIYAREFDLEDVLPGNLEGLMNYADFTTQPLLKLAVSICGGDPDLEIIQPVAISYTIAGVLRASSHYMRQGRCMLPEDLLQQYGLTKNSVFEAAGQEGVKSLVSSIIANRLPKSRPDHVVLKACEALSDMYFKQIKSLDCDVMSPELQRDPPFKALVMFWKIKLL